MATGCQSLHRNSTCRSRPCRCWRMSPYVHDPEQDWLYIVGRIKPGVAIAPLQEKVTDSAAAGACNRRDFFIGARQDTAEQKAHVVLTPGGAGIQAMQEGYGSHLHLLMWIAGLVLLIACANIANLLLVRGMGRRAEIVNARCAGSHARENHPPIADREHRAGRDGRYRRTRRRLCGSAHAADAGFSRSTESMPIHASPSLQSGVCVWAVAADRGSVRRGAGLDCGAGRPDRTPCAAARGRHDGSFFIATWAGGASGWTVTGAAGWAPDCFCKA